MRPVKYHSLCLFVQSCPIAVLEEVLRPRVLLSRRKCRGHVLEVGKVGLLPYYLVLELWEESWIGHDLCLHRARVQTWLLPLVGLMRVGRTEQRDERYQSFSILFGDCRVVVVVVEDRVSW